MAIRNVSLKLSVLNCNVVKYVVRALERSSIAIQTYIYRGTSKCNDQSQTSNDKDKDESICVILQLEETSVTMLRY